MNKKGFTLVELLGVIVILGLLAFLIFPSMLNIFTKGEEDINKAQEKLVISSAKKYVADYVNYYPKTNGNTYCIAVSDLVDNGYVKINADEILLDQFVKIVFNNNFDYSVVNQDDCSASNIPSMCFDTERDNKYLCNGNNDGYPKFSNIILANGSGIINNSIPFDSFLESSLNKVVIPEGVTEIGFSAFEHNNLVDLTIPSSLESIRHEAFNNNKIKMLNIKSDSNLSLIEFSAFENNKLESLDLYGKNLSIGDRAFANNQIKKLTINGTNLNISDRAFANNQLETVYIGDGKNSNISDNAFINNPNLQTIEIESFESCKVYDWGKILGFTNSTTTAIGTEMESGSTISVTDDNSNRTVTIKCI